MKKSPQTKQFVAALAALAISTTFASAQNIQVPRDAVVSSAKVSLSKGAYTNIQIAPATGSLDPATQTVSGTLANLNISATALIANATTTVTGTLTSKLSTGKVGNKELLQLIVGSTNSKDIRGLTLSAVVISNGLFGSVDPSAGANYVIGAKAKGTSPVLTRSYGPNTNGVSGAAGYAVWESIKANTKTKPFSGGFDETGYAGVSIELNGPVNGLVKKTNSLGGFANTGLTIETPGKFKQLRANGTNGNVTNSANGSFTTKPIFGGADY
jgi:hypothetical protein